MGFPHYGVSLLARLASRLRRLGTKLDVSTSLMTRWGPMLLSPADTALNSQCWPRPCVLLPHDSGSYPAALSRDAKSQYVLHNHIPSSPYSARVNTRRSVSGPEISRLCAISLGHDEELFTQHFCQLETAVAAIVSYSPTCSQGFKVATYWVIGASSILL